MKIRYPLLFFIFFYTSALISKPPQINWQFDTKDMSFGNACAGDLDGDGYLEIVFSTYFNDGHIYALNSEDGSLLWKYDIGGCSDAAPIIYDVDNDGKPEVILHSSSVPNMFCFNGADGSIKWKINSRATDSPPSIADVDGDGKPEIFDGDFGGYVARYNALDGRKVWEIIIDTGRVVQTEPVIEDLDGDGELDLAVASYSFDTTCSIVALRAKDGSILWRNSEKTKAIYHGPAVADVDNDGKQEVLVSDYGGTLYCLNGEDGSTSWKYRFAGGTYAGTPVTIADLNNDGRYEIIYFCDDRMGVISGDGKLLWAYRMVFGHYTFRGATVLDIDGDMYPDIVFGDNDGGLTALNGQNGGLIWYYDFADIYGNRFDLLHGIIASDFNKDGMIDIFFVGGWAEYPAIENNYGRAYMITAGIGKGPDWLMFRRNASRNAVLPVGATPVELTESESCFSLSPNPVNDLLQIKFSDEINSLKIINELGITVETGLRPVSTKNGYYEIDTWNYPVGTYFCLINSGKITETKKFIVVR